ncbi:MAG: hypothetical protein WCA12_19980 [Burkholderiales bacterium]
MIFFVRLVPTDISEASSSRRSCFLASPVAMIEAASVVAFVGGVRGDDGEGGATQLFELRAVF